jgi:hypothetical protein
MLADFLKRLVQFGVVMVVFMIVGIVLSIVISTLYVNSPNACRDCDIGPGLFGIGFCASFFVTPLVIYLGLRGRFRVQ